MGEIQLPSEVLEQLEGALKELDLVRERLNTLTYQVRGLIHQLQAEKTDDPGVTDAVAAPSPDFGFKKPLRRISTNMGKKYRSDIIGFDPKSQFNQVLVYPKDAVGKFALLEAEVPRAKQWMSVNFRGTHMPRLAKLFAENVGRIMPNDEINAEMRKVIPNFWIGSMVTNLRKLLLAAKSPYKIVTMYFEGHNITTQHIGAYGLFPAETNVADLEALLKDFV